jgi:hypothetical protein
MGAVLSASQAATEQASPRYSDETLRLLAGQFCKASTETFLVESDGGGPLPLCGEGDTDRARVALEREDVVGAFLTWGNVGLFDGAWLVFPEARKGAAAIVFVELDPQRRIARPAVAFLTTAESIPMNDAEEFREWLVQRAPVGVPRVLANDGRVMLWRRPVTAAAPE